MAVDEKSLRECANAIRFLSIDAVEKAQSGHPGMPMGMADIATVLWREFLQHNPNNPEWANRDRFVVSNGHGSMLLYALLHLTGYPLSLDEIKNFRSLHSQTPGHPEYGETPGVETTTGPLGQGLANAVGLAIAERMLAAEFNRPSLPVIDHYTYVFCGDGCLMEGISHEACSLAATQKLGKLIVFYDDNGISIDGNVEGWFTDDTAKRFEAYDWQVISDIDGHNLQAIREAIEQARANTTQPTLIQCRTHIAYGSPNLADTAKAHGAPLGKDEVANTREHLGWSHTPFDIPENVRSNWDSREEGNKREAQWQELWQQYQQKHPELAARLGRRLAGKLPDDWQTKSNAFIEKTQAENESIATRKASLKCLNTYTAILDELISGSADLSGSNLTLWQDAEVQSADNPAGKYIHYGVREFAMFAIMNGIALHGGFIPSGGTFLVFSDYGRNAIRLSALMKQRVIYVMTHDSIGLGEDGPTHQPIEHLAMLRLTPNVHVWRPCDGVETAVAWQQAIERQDGPAVLALSRQTLPGVMRDETTLSHVARGGYVLKDSQTKPAVILIATGSEVSIALEAYEQLNQQGIATRLVSMPCYRVFMAQSDAYRAQVIPPHVKARVIIEAGATEMWYRLAGSDGIVLGIDSFGASAPGKVLFEHFGLTSGRVCEAAHRVLQTAPTTPIDVE